MVANAGPERNCMPPLRNPNSPRGVNLRLIVSLTLMLAGGSDVNAQDLARDYPARPVRWVVGFPAGGSTAIVAPILSARLQERLGQPFLVENKPGAGSNIAAEAAVNAPADGYTL